MAWEKYIKLVCVPWNRSNGHYIDYIYTSMDIQNMYAGQSIDHYIHFIYTTMNIQNMYAGQSISHYIDYIYTTMDIQNMYAGQSIGHYIFTTWMYIKCTPESLLATTYSLNHYNRCRILIYWHIIIFTTIYYHACNRWSFK